MRDDEERYRSEVRATLKRALVAGLTGQEFLRALAGADPRLVEELMKEPSLQVPADGASREQRDAARRYAADLPTRLPAPNPMTSQWWFTLEGVESICAKARALTADGSAVFIGAPTAGHYYALCYEAETTILDADPEVIETVREAIAPVRQNGWTAETYDAHHEPPSHLLSRHAVAVLDPPWYPSLIRLFFSRARTLIRDSGFIVCVIPPLLTRPGLLEERSVLLGELQSTGYRIVTLEPQVVSYAVPSFELAAYQDVLLFSGRSWRTGDLLTVEGGKNSSPLPLQPSPNAGIVSIFSRDPRKLRVFLDETRSYPELGELAAPVPEFERSVSTRAFDVVKIGAWGSNRKAVTIREASLVRSVLEIWASGASIDDATAALVEGGLSEAEAVSAVKQIYEGLGLRQDEPGASWRRTPSQMEEFRQMLLSDLGSQPSARQHPHQDDDFRLAFQRDRDRILWSHSLRRLANKTQVFPVDRDDQLRRRLTHSVEVMQLAATIARAFGLDPDLTEAGALAHDLGHTPYGHAGEYALNSILNQIAPQLGGFNHYEHGADVVRWIEDAYVSPGIGGFPGLNLTRDTVECILKHTFYRRGDPLGQSEVLARSKHRDIDDSSGSLESQAIRMADKLSYLISDLEDGIRLRAITVEELRQCRLFDHPPIDMRQTKEESLLERFISQRRALLRVLMEDVLVATDFQLSRLGSLQGIREADEYSVAFSPTIKAEVDEIWTRLQAGILHRDGRVIQANLRAGAIVTELFLLYLLRPELVDDGFRRTHARLRDTEYAAYYRSLAKRDEIAFPKALVSSLAVDRMIGSGLHVEGDDFLVPVYDLVLAKDYVASLTDIRATTAHTELMR